MPADVVERRLTAADRVVAGVMCSEVSQVVPGDGEWLVRRMTALKPDAIGPLIAALLVPDVTLPPDSVCDLVGYAESPWFVTLADGSHVAPVLPSGGCHPSVAAMEALDRAHGTTTVTRVRRLLPESQLAAACYDGSKAFTGGGGVAGVIPPARVLPAGATGLSVCRYVFADGDTDRGSAQGGFTIPPIVATGVDPAVDAAAHAVFDHLLGADPSCSTPATRLLQVQQKRAADGDQQNPPLAAVEVGGCWRVMGPDFTVVGTADPAAVRALDGLATDPAHMIGCCIGAGAGKVG
jgi:hypothetical protein